MKVVQCPNGHYYNQEISACCPVCGKEPAGISVSDLLKTEAAESAKHNMNNAPVCAGNDQLEDLTVPIFGEEDDDDSLTVMMTDEGKVWLPVVGWIVCVKGSCRGRDYRIHSQRNFIGRAGDMDICIYEDSKIAMRSHCSIVHEPVKNEFMLVTGEDTTTYYNGEPLVKYAKLKEGDKFTIGESTFAFVPYCKGDVCW